MIVLQKTEMNTASILIVEDEAITAKAIGSTLQQMGYQISSIVDTGLGAIDAVAKNQPDLILMDIHLKGDMDGIEAAEKITSMAGVPIIFLTAYAEGSKIERAKSLLPFGYMLKPVQDRDLRISIEMALFAARAQKTNEIRQKAILDLFEMKNASTKEILDYTLKMCQAVTHSNLSFIGLMSDDEATMYIHSWSKKAMEQCAIPDKPKEFPVSESGLWGEVIRQRQPIMVNDYRISSGAKKGLPEGHVAIDNFMSVPVFENGKIVCIAAAANKEENYTNIDIQELKLLLDSTWQIIKQKRYEAENKILEKQFLHTQKMEAIGTLAGGIAHDFNNILQPIIGYAQMGIDGINDSVLNHRYYSQILTASNRAKDLVQQILMFSRQSDQDLKPLELQFIIKEVIQFLRSSLPTSINIQTHIDKNCGLVEANATQIHQVIMNLVSNAYHSMQHKGGELQIRLRPVDITPDEALDRDLSPGSYVCLSVSDTGEGMDQSLIDRVFDPYFTTKEKGKGTGLGLATVMGIVKGHNGHIQLSSDLGIGTTFHIFFPTTTKETAQKTSEKPKLIPTGNEKILLVDDEYSVVELQRDMLEPLGYDITMRTSSIDAYEAFKANPGRFDLVVTDMTMPNMTGDLMVERMLNINPNLPIILCTGFNELINEERAKKIGIRAFMMKPFTQFELANTIRQVLDQDE